MDPNGGLEAMIKARRQLNEERRWERKQRHQQEQEREQQKREEAEQRKRKLEEEAARQSAQAAFQPTAEAMLDPQPLLSAEPRPAAMFGVALGATDAHLAIDEAVKAVVAGASEEKPRAVKVVVAGERLVADRVLQPGPSLSEDFLEVAGVVEPGVPCIVLVRLEDGADYAMIAWTPSDSPVKLRMLCASSRQTLRKEFSDVAFKEYNATLRDEVTLEQFLDSTRTLTEQERHAAMTAEELDAERVKLEIAKEQAAAPKMLAGLVALRAEVQSSFEEAVRCLLAAPGTAVLARLVEPSAGPPQLAGESLEAVASPPQLRGQLPKDEACYVVMRREDEGLLLLSWLPDDASAKKKMKCSTFKASVLESLKEIVGDCPIVQAEVTAEDDLEESLGSSAPPAPAAAQPALPPPAAAAAGAAAAAAGGGPRPPVGGFALPGMGDLGRGGGGGRVKAGLGGRAGGRGRGAEGVPEASAEEPPAAQPEPPAEEAATPKASAEEPPAAQPKPTPEEPAAPEPAASPPAAAPPAEAPAPAAPAPAEAAAPASPACLSLAELRDAAVWKAKGVNASERETYLSDEEFQATFGMSKEAFAKLPKWKRDAQKKTHGLF